MPIRTLPRFATHASLYGLGSGALWVALAGLMGTQAVNAQITPKQRGGDFIAHRVVAGDTLEMLAARFLGDRTHWAALQSHNRVDNPFQLRPGSVLEIPTHLLRAATASVEFVQGDVRSSRSLSHLADTANMGSATSQAVQKGQLLQEGDYSVENKKENKNSNRKHETSTERF